MEQETNPTDDVNIEEIMQEIRRQILSKKQVGNTELPVAGRRFSPAFYEQLYRADLVLGDGGVKLDVTRSPVPIIGALIDKLRAKFHQLVIFYVNQAVIPQNEFNVHLFQAVTLLSQELEEELKSAGDAA